VRDRPLVPASGWKRCSRPTSPCPANRQGHHEADFAALLHRDEEVARAQRQLHAMIRDLLVEAAKVGDVSDDVPPEELASYCAHALAGPDTERSKAAVRRFLSLTLGALRPPP
jgi:hypothetical protein